mgnify:CR=1 FL=1
MIKKNRITLSRIFAFLLFVIIIISKNGWEDVNKIMTQILFLIGSILVAIGSLGRLWCAIYIAGYKSNYLITSGPYSISRNPLYFFSLIGAIGVGFASESFLLPLLITAGFSIYYPFVIKAEEHLSLIHI